MSDAEFHRLTSGPHVEVALEGQAGLTARGGYLREDAGLPR
jgi:hypothetical protein